MAKTYNYISELKKKLSDYNSIDNQIKELETKKEDIRDQIEKWLDLHQETLFEISDNNEQLWKLTKTTSHSHRIKDYDLLKAILPQEHRHLVVESDSEKFSMRRIDKHSKEWLTSNL